MKRLLSFALILILIAACKEEPKKPLPKAMTTNSNVLNGEVLETIDASNYTYIKVKQNDQEIWIAGPNTKVEKGETVYFTKGMEMKNFESKSLGKTFKSIFFVDKVSTKSMMMSASGTNPHGVQSEASEHKSTQKAEAINIAQTGDAKTIANIYEHMNDLQGKEIKVKGKVVKYNASILNRNWIHIQDGSDFNGDYDLLVTTQEEVKIGDIITVSGKIAVDVDFGAGYSYKVLVEEAKILETEM